jgi:hypothetical protein
VQYNTAKSVDGETDLGGGNLIASGATVYIDSFTVTNTTNNTDNSALNGSTANIDGSYILRSC